MQIKEKYIYFNGKFVLRDDAKICDEKDPFNWLVYVK